MNEHKHPHWLDAVCEHSIVRKICQWCQRDMARAGFVPLWALTLKRGRTAIDHTRYEYARELIELAEAAQ